MASSGLGLPQTKGIFELRGLVTGMKRDNAFKSITTKSKKDMRILNFGVKTAPESVVYVTLQGMEKDEVYFSKKAEKKGEKSEVIKVKWAKRHEEQEEGFRLIGVSVGLEKNEDGKNIVENLTEYDAAKKIYNKLEDDTPIYVRGELEFSSFSNDKNELIRNKRFAIKNLYLANKDIDFDAEDFEEVSRFKQKIIFMGIERVDDKNDPRFQVDAKIVTYNSVEDTHFIIRDRLLANQFKKNLKPYTAIDVWGRIVNKAETEEIENEERGVWGEEDVFKNVNKSYVKELVITGADPNSIDTETYSKKVLEEALKAIKEFGETEEMNDTWGEEESGEKVIDDSELPW